VPSIYLCDVEGDGTAGAPFRAAIPREDAQGDPIPFRYSCLMIDTTRGKAVIYSPHDNWANGTTIRQLVTGNSRAQMLSRARTTSPNTVARTTINAWLTAGGYATLPAAADTWLEVVLFVARQVNPVADLDRTDA